MSATPYEICEQIINGIAADPAVDAVVAKHYPSRKLSLYLGVDPNDLPPEASAPWFGCTFSQTEMPGEDNRHTRVHEIACVLAIETTTSPVTAGRVVKHQGSIALYDIWRLIESRIFSVLQPATMDFSIMETGRASAGIALPYLSLTWTIRVGTAA